MYASGVWTVSQISKDQEDNPRSVVGYVIWGG